MQEPFSIRVNTGRCRSNPSSKGDLENGDLAASIRRALSTGFSLGVENEQADAG